MANYLLGIDIGTESSRAIIFDEEGKALVKSQVTYGVVCNYPGWAAQDPEQWWQATVTNCRRVLNESGFKPSQIAAIGVCGQMHAPVPIRGKELIPGEVQLWCDKRCEDQCRQVVNKYDSDQLIKKTGNVPVPSWTGLKIKWIKENQPDLYAKATKFLSAKDYINFKLTGNQYTDLSEASGTFLLDPTSLKWSHEIAELLDLELNKLPEIVNSWQIIGHVTAEAAQETGLAVGTPVVAGGGDMPCLLLGAGLTKLGRACDVAGTACDISVFGEEPCIDPRLMNLHHVIPGWFTFGILDSGGSSYRWLRDNFCEPQIEEAEQRGISAYEILNELAEKVEAGAGGLIYLPYLMGERVLGSAFSRGVFFGLTLTHGRANLARAIIEGITFDLRQSLEIICSKGKRIDEIRFIGGGARSPLWGKIKANIYGIPVVTVEEFEGGALGAAILAGRGIGLFADVIETTEKLIKIRWQFWPNIEEVNHYNSYYKIFKKLHDLLQPLFGELGAVSYKA
jgi:xylulokinase